VASASVLGPPYRLGDCREWKVERSSNWPTVAPYPSDRAGRTADGLGWEEGKEEALVDVVYASAAPSHHQGVPVFHGGRGGHFAQMFLSRYRTQICTSQARPGEGYAVKDERLLFRMGTNVALQMFEACEKTLAVSIVRSAMASMGEDDE
jgi:hypothetical protein